MNITTALFIALMLHIVLGTVSTTVIPKQNKKQDVKHNGDGSGYESVELKILPKANKRGKSNLKCDKYYTGIGIYTIPNGDACIIRTAIEGYPANRAGIRTGDVIVSPSCYMIRGDEGVPLYLTYERDGVRFTVTLIREKICEG